MTPAADTRATPGLPRALLALGAAALVAACAVAGAAASAHFGHQAAVGALGGVVLAAGGYLLATVELSVVFSIAIALSIFSGNARNLGLPIGPDRLLIAFGCARLYVATRRREHPGYGAPHWLVLVAGVYAVLSAAWHLGQQDHQSAFELLDRFGLVPFLMFWLAPIVFATERDRRVLLITLLVVGAYLGLTAIFELAGPSSLVWPRYIMNPDVGIGFGRARGPFAEAGSNGIAMHACAVAGLILLPSLRRPSLRLLVVAVVGLCAVGILLTLTRQVWVGAVLSLVAVPFAGRRVRRVALPVAAVVALGVVGAYIAVPGFQARAHERANDQRPVWDRLNLNAAAFRMIDRKPVLGWGWNGFRTHSTDFIRQADTYPETAPVTGVHNVLLANLVELGLLGTVLWAAALVTAVGGAILRRPPPGLEAWRTGLVALAVMWLTVVNLSPTNSVLPNMLVWLWAGIVWRQRVRARA